MAILSDQKNIWVAASDGDLARVRVLIEQQHLGPNVPDQFTYTPMHAAASYGHLHVLEYLIERGGDVNVTDEDGDTPLYTVETIPTAQFLVQHGATIDHRNNDGISPIEHLREDFPQIASYLESLLPSNSAPTSSLPLAAAAAAANSSPSQHAQNAASESLTDTLMQRIQNMVQQEGADVDEEALRQAVTTTVLEGIAAGFQLQQESSEHSTAEREADTQDEKRMRRE